MSSNKTRLIETAIVLAIVLLSGCAAPTVEKATTEQPRPIVRTEQRDVARLLLEAERTIPPRSTELRIQAARLALLETEVDTAKRILESLESPYATDETTRNYSFLRAEVALLEKDPRHVMKLLDDKRFQRLRLNEDLQIRIGRLRAEAYLQGRSYLASARELIYIDNLLPTNELQANHEKIFSTLLELSDTTLHRQAEQSITSDIRGWLSLAAMTKRYQHDPLRQLNALNNWQKVWPNHPAAIMVPRSLQLLSKIVEEQPKSIALLLPLKGELGQYGRAIRDGFIAAHYEHAPETRLHIFDTTEADVLEMVSRAESLGVELIVGPLDRTRVTRLARTILDVPVIALNRTLDGEINPNMYQFGLAPEDESIQVAEQIFREGRLKGLVIAPDNEWGQRNFDAFSYQFTSLGGVIVDSARFREQRDYSDMVKSLLNVDTSEERAADLRRITGERFQFTPRRRQDIDFVFLLSNPTQARGINPTLAFFYAEDIPVYATSHVHVSTDSRIDIIDMNGIRFCDIPWKLTSNDKIQQTIQETWEDSPAQLAPFYALGLDVHRLYPRLQQLKEYEHEKVFGSTGILTLSDENVVRRTLMWAQFKDGEVESVPMIFGI